MVALEAHDFSKEIQLFKVSIGEELVVDDVWHVIATSWLRKWKQYVNFGGLFGTEALADLHPGPIINKGLSDTDTSLRKDIIEIIDYEIVTSAFFTCVREKYDVDITFPRTVISKGGDESKTVELYPILITYYECAEECNDIEDVGCYFVGKQATMKDVIDKSSDFVSPVALRRYSYRNPLYEHNPPQEEDAESKMTPMDEVDSLPAPPAVSASLSWSARASLSAVPVDTNGACLTEKRVNDGSEWVGLMSEASCNLPLSQLHDIEGLPLTKIDILVEKGSYVKENTKVMRKVTTDGRQYYTQVHVSPAKSTTSLQRQDGSGAKDKDQKTMYPRDGVWFKWLYCLKKGDQVDGLDAEGDWWAATVVDERPSFHGCLRSWPEKFDCWVLLEELTSRIAPLYSRTTDWRAELQPGSRLDAKIAVSSLTGTATDEVAIWRPVTVKVVVRKQSAAMVELLQSYPTLKDQTTQAKKLYQCDLSSDSVAALHTHTLVQDIPISTQQLISSTSSSGTTNVGSTASASTATTASTAVTGYGTSYSSYSSTTYGMSGMHNSSLGIKAVDRYYGYSVGSPVVAGATGLKNLGNTCFMNSMLQCLSNTPLLTNYFLSDRYLKEINRDNPLGHKGEVAEAYGRMLKDIWSRKYTVVAPTEVKRVVGEFCPQFAGYQQQDSQEFMQFLLDGLHEDCNRILKKPSVEAVESNGRTDDEVASESWERHLLRNDSAVLDSCFGLLKSHVTCTNCGKESVTFDAFSSLSLPIPVKQTKTLSVCVFLLPVGSQPLEVVVEVSLHMTIKDVKHMVLQYVMRYCQQQQHSVSSSHGLTSTDHVTRQLHGLGCLGKRTCSDASVNTLDNNVHGAAEGCTTAATGDVCKMRLDRLVVGLASSHSPNRIYRILSDDAMSAQELCKTYHNTYMYVCEHSVEPDEIQSHTNGVHTIYTTYSAPPLTSAATAATATTAATTTDDVKYMYVDLLIGTPRKTYQSPHVVSSTVVGVPFTVHTVPRRFTIQVSGASSVEDHSTSTDTAFTNQRVHALFWSFVQPLCLATYPDSWNIDVEARPYKIYIASSVALVSKHEIPCDGNVCVVGAGEALVAVLSSDFAQGGDFNEETLKPIPFVEDDGADDVCADECVGDKEERDNAMPHTHVDTGLCGTRKKAKKMLNIYQCVNKFCEKEQLSPEETFYCSACKQHLAPIKKMDIYAVPDVLIIHLKRFNYVPNSYFVHREKIAELIDFPIEGLDMSSYMCGPVQSDAPPVYDLYGVSEHSGGLGGGHYTAVCKNPIDEEWYNYNDASCYRTHDVSEVVSSQAYVLFYKRRTGVSPWGGMLPDRSSLVVDAIRQHQTLHIPPAAPSPASEADRDTPHPHTCDSSSAASRNEEIDDALLD